MRRVMWQVKNTMMILMMSLTSVVTKIVLRRDECHEGRDEYCEERNVKHDERSYGCDEGRDVHCKRAQGDDKLFAGCSTCSFFCEHSPAKLCERRSENKGLPARLPFAT